MHYTLNAKDIRKTFKGPEPLEILKGVSLQVQAGTSVAILGKSGCGKSTLLHILGTLEPPTSGDLEICGKSALSSLRNAHIGFIFQSFHLLEEYSLIDNILMPAKIARKPTDSKSPACERALDLLIQVDLLPKAHLPTKLLSGGEKQRAAIARAFCNNPSIILADEPTGNLDPVNAKTIQELLLRCSQKHSKSLILVTHDDEFASLCDSKYVLKDGFLEPLA